MTLALPLAFTAAPGLAPDAVAQSNSGIYINNDVLNSLGSGPGAAPAAPLAPSPYAPSQQPGYAQPLAPLAPAAPQGGTGGLTFQTLGSGNFVVTRPGTLLFPPLHAPSSTLAPGFQHDNNAARTEALNNAFAGGPEPSSQLLIPLENPGSGSIDDNDAVVVFEDQLPAREPQQAGAPVLRLRPIPPNPAPPKPAVPAAALAEIQQAPSDLAPEFRGSEPAAAAPAVAEVPPIADVEEKALAETPAEPDPATDGPSDQSGFAAGEPAGVDETPAPSLAEAPASDPASDPVSDPVSDGAPASSAPVSSAEMAPPVAMAEKPAETPAPAPAPSEASAPVSLLPAGISDTPAAGNGAPQADGTPAGLQTASLTMDRGVEDMTFLFEVDSAELSAETQAELRSLADTLRGSGDSGIQVLGFASGQDGSEDQARKLALSRALKVRSFLIDAGIPSARIKVRSLGDRTEGGPANRVDIRPIGS